MPSAETSTENASDNMIFEQEATLVGRFFCVLIAFGDEEVTSGRVCGHTDL